MIEVSVNINSNIKDVWEKYTSLEDVQYWGLASEDWAAEGIENDVRTGGKFENRNFAKDGSFEFMFSGVYTKVEPQKLLAYSLDDGRKVEVHFSETENGVSLSQSFDPETENPEEQQKTGWQAYLDNFKKYVESSIQQ
jgi:uncharacterized protein YndB with AHSA1/START domain